MKNYLNQEEELKEDLAEKLRIEVDKIKKMNKLVLKFLDNHEKFEILKKFLVEKLKDEQYSEDDKAKLAMLIELLTNLEEQNYVKILKLRSLCSGPEFLYPSKTLKACCKEFSKYADNLLEKIQIKFLEGFEINGKRRIIIKDFEDEENSKMLEKILEHQLRYKNDENKEKKNKGKVTLARFNSFCGSSSYREETPSD
uniref:Uncharacterized protein n=1 Tax=Meloidogyne javanica TaxID=6303 RepID=A0A915N5C4_MELJA